LLNFDLIDRDQLPNGIDIGSVYESLREILPRVSQPTVGDVAFYPGGYVLFYLLNKDNKPFVIGMTPSGIVALDPNFAEPVGFGRPDYRRLER
jgi:hypothetical protein